ncbi:energy-coupling factor ABC transporter permease [Clostridium sp.]|uniref:energy-coupling factor ABC transporter permease n=1 Tax=Clostridium sp. TaxID=1506 RepID=UPI002FCC2E4A
MHMADALISPIVGGTMWVATAGITTYSIKKLQTDFQEEKIPLMGVMGAFVFASQMINFTIPGTGSSGHLGGGMLLAAMLGPYAGFIVMASILAIQALFFADGGLIALGCNIFNLGFYTCFIAYPLVYKNILKKGCSKKRIITASMLAAIIGLQLGAFSVVLQTFFSGKTELPFSSFVTLMQPIHLAIGIVEGVVTAAVISFVWKARPNTVDSFSKEAGSKVPVKKIILPLAIATIIVGAVLSWFASSNPDGLEWAMFKSSGKEEIETNYDAHKKAATIQENTAILPDYGFKTSLDEVVNSGESKTSWPAVDPGTSVSGLVGGAMTLTIGIATGIIINIFKKRRKAQRKESLN